MPRWTTMIALLALGAAGCDDRARPRSGSGPTSTRCTPGRISQCRCPVGSDSVMVCGEDGHYGQCQCGDTDGGASTTDSGGVPPDGAASHPDAAPGSDVPAAPDALFPHDGGVGQPDAVVVPPHDAGFAPDAIVTYPDAIVTYPDAIVTHPDAVVTYPDAVVTYPDALPHDSGVPTSCVHNPNGCVPHELMGPPPTCTCLHICEFGYQWNATLGLCLPAPPPDSGVHPDATAPDTGVAPDAGVPPTDPFDPVTVATALSTAQCQYRTRCEPALHVYVGQTEQQCITEGTVSLLASYAAYPSVIAAGRLGFSNAALIQCANEIATADCVIGLPATSCTNIFTGAQPVGRPCAHPVECVASAYCDISAWGQCGRCQARALQGASCASALCATGSQCMNVAGQAQCINIDLPLGASCGTAATGLCRGRMQCVGSTAGTCQRPSGFGQPCDPQEQTQPSCNIYQNHVCDPVMNTCAQVSWVGVGSGCSTTSVCTEAGYCDGTTCLAMPTAGQACQQSTCASGHYCDGTNCQAERTQGAACGNDIECGGEMWCVNSQCGSMTWTQCN